jgi:hypothetical protein
MNATDNGSGLVLNWCMIHRYWSDWTAVNETPSLLQFPISLESAITNPAIAKGMKTI